MNKKTLSKCLLLTLLIFSLTLGGCGKKAKSTQNTSSNHLFVVGKKIDGKIKYGFINIDGKEVIKPQFDRVDKFSEGLAAVKLNDKWGFIDKNGKIQIKPQFDEQISFSEGLATVQKNNKWGYINKSGNTVINCNFDLTLSFSDNIAIVGHFNKGTQFKNPNLLHTFKNACINKKGDLVIPYNKYNVIKNFKNGRALACKKNKWGVIDKKGNTLIPFDYDKIEVFNNCMYKAFKNGNWGVINKNNKTILPFNFKKLGFLSDELIFAKTENEKGYIDITGTWILKPKFDIDDRFGLFCNFSEGLVCAKDKNKYGFINKKGDWVINPKFDRASMFKDGICALYQNKSFILINKKGNLITNEKFDLVTNFSNGLAKVYKKNKGWYYINKKGHFVAKTESTNFK